MFYFRQISMGLLLIILIIGCSNQPMREDDRAINELLSVIKTDEILAQLPALVASSTGQMQTLEPTKRKQLKQGLQEAFDPVRLKQQIVTSLRKSYHPQRYQTALKAMQSDIHKRMLKVEMQATKPEFYNGLEKYAGSLESNLPPRERIALMQKLDEVSNGVEANVTIQMGFIKGMLRGAMMLDAPEKRLSEAQLQATFQQLEAKIRSSAGEQSLITNLYIYRDVSAADLNAYIHMYEQPQVNWFLDQFVNAFSEALEHSGQLMVQKMSG